MIEVGNVFAKIDSGPERVVASRVLKYRPKGYRFTQTFRNGRWDGWSSMMGADGQFPSGLVDLITRELHAAGHVVEIDDRRVRPTPDPTIAPATLLYSLMDHQQRAVEDAYRAGRGLIEHPVGAGKTRVLVELTRRCAVPTLVLTHRKDLLYQLYEEFVAGLDIKGLIGIIGDGHWDELPITIATFQTINAAMRNYPEQALAFLKSRQAVLIDECHHLQAKTYEDVMKKATNAYYRYGCSATVFKSGDRETTLKVQAWTGPVVSKESFIEERQVPADIFVIDYNQSAGVVDLPWPQDYERGLVQNDDRNRLIAELVSLAPKPILVLIERVAHGEHLWDLVSEHHQNTSFIYGKDTSKTRRIALDRFRSGETDVLVSSVILDEGIDLPNIKCLVLAGGGKAQHRIIQRIGRGMRTSSGKTSLLVFDFKDRGKYIGAHYRKRRTLYNATPEYQVFPMTATAALDAMREAVVKVGA